MDVLPMGRQESGVKITESNLHPMTPVTDRRRAKSANSIRSFSSSLTSNDPFLVWVVTCGTGDTVPWHQGQDY